MQGVLWFTFSLSLSLSLSLYLSITPLFILLSHSLQLHPSLVPPEETGFYLFGGKAIGEEWQLCGGTALQSLAQTLLAQK